MDSTRGSSASPASYGSADSGRNKLESLETSKNVIVDSNRLQDDEQFSDTSSLMTSASQTRFLSVDESLLDEDSGSSGSEEELEPQLKYERLSSDLKTILSEDSASCIAVHSKLMALGTHWGQTHTLDALGNSISGKTTIFELQTDFI